MKKACNLLASAKGCCIIVAAFLTVLYGLMLSETYALYDTGMFSFIFPVLGIALLVLWISVFACKK